MATPSTSSTILQNVSIKWEPDSLTLSPANKPHRYCLLFLQGRNMSVHQFLSIFLSQVLLELLSDFKIVFPIPAKTPEEAKPGVIRHVYSWYNYLDVPTVHEAKAKVEKILKKEIELLDNDASRVFLGAFSQGCFLCLYIMSEMKEKLGGVLLTAGFNLEEPILNIKDDLPPVLVLHGEKDKVVRWDHPRWGYKEWLSKKSVKLVVLEDMGHDLANKDAQKVMYDFIRGITRRAPKPHL